MDVGSIIKKLRKEKGMTQIEFSKKVGISRSYLSDLENNRKSLSVNTIEKIANKLNMDISITFVSKP